jgi:hypothetical protein
VLPAAIAAASIVLGFIAPFVALPTSMVALVAVAAADIQNRSLRTATIGLVVFAIAINLALVMMALPAARHLVEGVL